MKKLFKSLIVLVGAFLFSAASYSQNGYVPVYVVSDTGVYFQRVLEIGTPIYCVSTNTWYITKVKVGKTNAYSLGWLLGSASRYGYPTSTVTTFNSRSDTNFVHTTGNESLYGNKTFQGTLYVKAQTLTQTNTNMLTANNSLKVTDTLFIAAARNYWFENTVNGLKCPNSMTATDTVFGAVGDYTGNVVTTGGNVTIKAQTLTQTNTNKLTANNSVAVTDSLFIGGTNNYVFQLNTNDLKFPNSITVPDSIFIGSTSGNYILQDNVNDLKFPNSITVTDTAHVPVLNLTGALKGTTALVDTLHFGTDASGSRNLYARKKITGIAATDRFIVVPLMGSTVAKPGTAEFLGYYCTTDSIVVSRNTASTAGLIVTFIRIR